MTEKSTKDLRDPVASEYRKQVKKRLFNSLVIHAFKGVETIIFPSLCGQVIRLTLKEGELCSSGSIGAITLDFAQSVLRFYRMGDVCGMQMQSVNDDDHLCLSLEIAEETFHDLADYPSTTALCETDEVPEHTPITVDPHIDKADIEAIRKGDLDSVIDKLSDQKH